MTQMFQVQVQVMSVLLTSRCKSLKRYWSQNLIPSEDWSSFIPACQGCLGTEGKTFRSTFVVIYSYLCSPLSVLTKIMNCSCCLQSFSHSSDTQISLRGLQSCLCRQTTSWKMSACLLDKFVWFMLFSHSRPLKSVVTAAPPLSRNLAAVIVDSIFPLM